MKVMTKDVLTFGRDFGKVSVSLSTLVINERQRK